VRSFLYLVLLSNALHGLCWLWAFRRLHGLIRSPEIRSVQVWVHARKVEVVSIYKRLQGEVSVQAPMRKRNSASCAICLQTLTPRADDRRSLSVRRSYKRISTPNRSNSYGVVNILTTPCKHKFHESCIGRCLDRLCPLCKAGVGVIRRTCFPFP
jgi:hypothetical protein